MYDKQHAPEHRDIMTCEYEGERISYSYLPPKNHDEHSAQAAQYRILGAADLWPDGALPGVCRRAGGRLARLVASSSKRPTSNGPTMPAPIIAMSAATTSASLTRLTDQYYDRTKRGGRTGRSRSDSTRRRRDQRRSRWCAACARWRPWRRSPTRSSSIRTGRGNRTSRITRPPSPSR